jgi:hypothetical protein
LLLNRLNAARCSIPRPQHHVSIRTCQLDPDQTRGAKFSASSTKNALFIREFRRWNKTYEIDFSLSHRPLRWIDIHFRR